MARRTRTTRPAKSATRGRKARGSALASKPAGKSAGAGRRSGGRRQGGSGSSAPARRASRGPATGRGPGAAEIGRDMVTRINLGQFEEIYEAWYHPRIQSLESDGSVWKGMKGIHAKNEWWYANHDVHSCSAEGPFVGATGFAIHYRMAFTPRGAARIDMTEIGVYTVRDGKIVREEYLVRKSGVES